jgi:hypothetical protein
MIRLRRNEHAFREGPEAGAEYSDDISNERKCNFADYVRHISKSGSLTSPVRKYNAHCNYT